MKSLSARAAFWFVAAAISIVVLAANTPIPLLTIYQARWHLSTGVLTTVCAVYSAGVVAAVFGMVRFRIRWAAGACSFRRW